MVFCNELFDLMKRLNEESIPYDYDVEFGVVNAYDYFFITWDGKYKINFYQIGFGAAVNTIEDVLKVLNDYKEEAKEFA